MKTIYELKCCFGQTDTYSEQVMYISEDLEVLKKHKRDLDYIQELGVKKAQEAVDNFKARMEKEYKMHGIMDDEFIETIRVEDYRKFGDLLSKLDEEEANVERYVIDRYELSDDGEVINKQRMYNESQGFDVFVEMYY